MQLIRKSLVATAIFSVCSGAMAAGFQITEHSAKSLGRSNAGEAAVAEDASVVAANPALMTKFKRPMMSVVGAYIMPDIDIEGTTSNYFTTGGTPVATYNNDVAPNAFVPEAYYVAPINDQWSWGIGGFSNFGLMTDYNSAAMTNPLADKTDLKTYNLNPSLAYKVDDSLSVGFGINIVYAEATLTSSVPAGLDGSTLADAFGFDGQLITELKGDDYGWGWNLGVTYDFSPATRIGFAYRSKVDLTFDGTIDTGILPTAGNLLLGLDPTSQTAAFLAGLPAKFDEKLDLTLPAIWELALNQQLTSDLSLQASVNRIEWSDFDKLVGKSARGAMLLDQPENWKDAWYYSAGLTYVASSDITLRAGMKYDNTPVRDEYRTLRIPDSKRMWYSAGLTYRFSKDLDVDVSYSYLDSKKASINEGEVVENGSPSLTGNFSGEMSGSAQIFALQANYRF